MQNDASKEAGLTLQHWSRDLPASIIVFLTAMPLCMAVAIASGAPVATGLISGIIGGVVVGLLAGAPLQVSGPAAGLSFTVFALIQTLGIEKLGVCVLVAGILQLCAGYLRLGQWFRAVAPPVVQGMLAGIGVLLIASQMHVMLDHKPHQNGIQNLLTIPEAIANSLPLPALGNLEERSLATKELRTLGQTHLLQAELKEQVHHVISAVDMTDTTQEVDTDAEKAIAVELLDLRERQREVVAQLDALTLPRGTKSVQKAREAIALALTDLDEGDIFHARASQDNAEAALGDLLASSKNHGWAAMIGMVTIIIILAWKLLSGRLGKVAPPLLVAVAVVTLITALVEIPVLYVELPDRLTDEVFLPSFAEFGALLEPITWLFILQLTFIASAETLLCATAIDRMQAGPRSQFDRELKAQGIGNVLCGFLCVLPITGVIVRSTANVSAGARTRLSSILQGVWILLFGALFVAYLRYVPTAALAGILVYSGFRLIDINAVKALMRRGRGDVAIFAATVIAIVATDILTGVLVGIGLSLVKLIYVFSRLEIAVEPESGNKRLLCLRGSATFLRLPALADALEQVPTNAELHVRVNELDYIDTACLDLLEGWEAQNQADGARLVIDAESLQARFWRRRSTAALAETNGNGNLRTGSSLHRQMQRPI